ncbi:hypothetical protein [Oceanobacillus picturae]|uniref:hypothetical protein n=1 Tax=Oceanobacillus picturae TaxID=171693 RepID=UPI0015FFAAD8|nr:hypothetical protein [Oceanobacillus picturae]
MAKGILLRNNNKNESNYPVEPIKKALLFLMKETKGLSQLFIQLMIILLAH